MPTRSEGPEDAAQPVSESTAKWQTCLSPAAFWHPLRSCENSGWTEHVPFAFWLIDAVRPRTLVELGTHTGCSYLAFCQAIRALSVETRAYAVDTWYGDEHAGFYNEDIFEDLRRHHDKHYSGFSRLVRSTFDDAVSHFEDHSIDLLHIDGRHYIEDVAHDFATWKIKVATNGIVLFHDTNVRERGFGVHQLWNELRNEFPSFEFLHGNGLGVICLGTPPEALQPLLDIGHDPDAQAAIRDTYSRLGQAITDFYSVEKVRSELNAQLRDLVSVRAELKTARTEIERSQVEAVALAAALAERDRKIGYLHAINSRATRTASESKAQIERLQLNLVSLERERQDLKGSTSWRVTRPLRALKTRFDPLNSLRSRQ